MNIENLKKLRTYVKDNRESINIEMKEYAESYTHLSEDGELANVPTCGSSCCLIGHAVAVAPPELVKEYCVWGSSNELRYNNFSTAFFGIRRNDPEYAYLFNADRNNDVDDAIKRLTYVIEHESVPKCYIGCY